MSSAGNRYFIIYKPYNMVSQFVSSHDVNLLGDLDFVFPEGIHAIGRLDNHSEGLLILTTNKKVTRLLFQGEELHKRTYLVKVKNVMNDESLNKLRTGISIRVKGGGDYVTTPCHVDIVPIPTDLTPHIYGLRDDIPHTWLNITLTEGKYHQVRKMVRMIHHRCQRLIRVAIEDITIGDMKPGEVREMEENDFFEKLKIHNWNT